MPIEPWTTLTSELVVDNRWMRVRRDSATTPRGVFVPDYYYLDGGHFTMTFAVTEADEVLWVRQFKYPVRSITVELPAGVMEPTDPEPIDGARRELREETGYGGGAWQPLGQFFQSTGKASTVMHAYLATGVQRLGDQQPDPAEEIELLPVPMAEVLALATSGEVRDVHSQAVTLQALRRLQRL